MKDTDKYLSDEAVVEFDRIVSEYERPLMLKKVLRWVGSIAAAAAIALPLMISRPWEKQEESIDTVAMIEGIKHLMELDTEEIISISAVPNGSQAILTANMKDGSTRSFIMTMDRDGISFHLTANNQ